MCALNISYDDSRYPDGVQDFATMREYNMLYVDKTEYIYRMSRRPGSYFLSRPRRFGKSLLLSTMQAYFEGRRQLFDGLAVAGLETDWISYPVVRIDLSQGMFLSTNEAVLQLNTQLDFNFRRLGLESGYTDVISRFQELIITAYERHGQKVVVLIDEYDKPLLETLYEAEELHRHMHALMRGFYGCIKGCSQYLRFVFITGVTKFTHVNIFSGLNNLTDLSLQPAFNAMCGISESEMRQYFENDMKIFAELNGMTPEAVRDSFRHYYDGYRFAREGENIYNPYSVVLAFQGMHFSNYWFASGTPNHMVRAIARQNFDFTHLEGRKATSYQLMGAPTTDGNPLGLLYQSGYLTIKDYNDDVYTLGFPNKEVESGFFDAVLRQIDDYIIREIPANQ